MNINIGLKSVVTEAATAATVPMPVKRTAKNTTKHKFKVYVHGTETCREKSQFYTPILHNQQHFHHLSDSTRKYFCNV